MEDQPLSAICKVVKGTRLANAFLSLPDLTNALMRRPRDATEKEKVRKRNENRGILRNMTRAKKETLFI
jgi:hypothetical protein